MSEPAENSSNDRPEVDTQLKPGTTPPPAWLLRTLSIAALSFTIFGFELILSGIIRGSSLPFNGTEIPTYIPGGIFLILGVRNLWSWNTMKQAIERGKQPPEG